MVALAMSVMILGLVLLVLGWPGFQRKVIAAGLILIASGMSIGIFGSPSRDMPNGSQPMVILGLLGVAIVIIWALIGLRKGLKEHNQTKSETIGGTALDRFFVECVLSEINDFSIPKNRQKAELLADKYKISYPNGIEQLYQQGLESHKVITQHYNLTRLENKRTDERKQYDILNKYSDLTGKDKRIAILTDQANSLSSKAKSEDAYAATLIRSTQQQEYDWAFWGGVADGLAGFGAGVSTAVDMQLENIKIRAENEKRRKAALPAYFSITNSATENRSRASKINKEIENTRMKLLSNESSADLMKKISFINTDVLVSETGAAMVCTSASVIDTKFVIFDDVPAVIDGTIIAQIYDGDHLCGTAQMVLPLYGLGHNITLHGICLSGFKPEKNYTVKFVEKNLWAMER